MVLHGKDRTYDTEWCRQEQVLVRGERLYDTEMMGSIDEKNGHTSTSPRRKMMFAATTLEMSACTTP